MMCSRGDLVVLTFTAQHNPFSFSFSKDVLVASPTPTAAAIPEALESQRGCTKHGFMKLYAHMLT